MIATIHAAALFLPVAFAVIAADFDLVIRNARIVDGTGAAWYRGDVGGPRRHDRAVAPSHRGAGRAYDRRAGHVRRARIHRPPHARSARHLRGADRRQLHPPGRDDDPRRPGRRSPCPLHAFLDRLESAPEVARTSAASSARARCASTVIGHADRDARRPRSLSGCARSCAAGMRDGAFGLSTGLFYVPGAFTPIEEVIELRKRVAGEIGGVHTRTCATRPRRSSTACARRSASASRAACRRRSRTQGDRRGELGRTASRRCSSSTRPARAGVDVTIDQYPYTASSTSHPGGAAPGVGARGRARAKLLKRLRDPQARAKIKRDRDRSHPEGARRRRPEERRQIASTDGTRRSPGRTSPTSRALAAWR